MKMLRLLAALFALAIPASAQLIDYRSLGPTYFGSNTISGVKGIVTGMIGTNSIDGSITNRNQSLGKVSIAGTNSVITADTGPHALSWLYSGETSGVPVIQVRSDGSIFSGKDVGVDVNLNNYNNMHALYAAGFVESNSPANIYFTLSGINNENYNYYSTLQGYITTSPNAPVVEWTMSARGTNNVADGFFVELNPASPGGSSMTYTKNFVEKFRMDSVGDLVTIKGVTYSWPTGYGADTNYVLTDTNKAGSLSWQPGLLSTAGTNEIRSLATNVINQNARIGPGTANFIPKWIASTNITDSSVHQVETNQWNWNVRTNYSANTNSFTNRFYGEFTSTNNWQAIDYVVNPPGSSLYNGIFPKRGSGDARAQNKFNLYDSWVVNGVGSGSGADAAGDWLPLNDNTENIGSGSQRVHDFFAGRIYIATPLSSGPQWGDSVGGTGMGLTTDATMIQFFRNTGITAAFNKERNAGTLQFDLAGNLLGFGSGISNTAAYFQDSGVAGLIGIGTNNSTTSPLRVGLMPKSANGTDKGGPQMVILGGAGTGTGRGGDIAFGTARPSTTGLTVNSYTTNFFIAANPVTLTESSDTTVFSVALATNKSIGMMVTATTVANDGSVYQSVIEQFAISAAVDAAYTPVVSASAPIATYQRSGTLTTTWTAVQNAGVIDVKCNAVSSLTQTTLKVLGYQVVINTDGTAVITPQ